MPPQTKPKKHSISNTAAALLITLALVFDGIQAGANLMHAIPVIGTAAAIIFTILLNVWAYLSIWLGFKLADPNISFLTPKRAAALNGGLLIELIPVINALPAWTLAVVIIVVTTRGEEVAAAALQTVGTIPIIGNRLKERLRKTAAYGHATTRAGHSAQFAQGKAPQSTAFAHSATIPQQPPPSLPKTPRQSPYEKGKAYIDEGRDYIRKDLGKEYAKGKEYIGQGQDFVRSGTSHISPKTPPPMPKTGTEKNEPGSR